VAASPGKPAGGVAWASVRSLSWAAVTAQMARAAMTRTAWRWIAVQRRAWHWPRPRLSFPVRKSFARQLQGADVPPDAIRVEDQSADTWQNVELSMPYLREAVASGLRLAVVSKWYHRRAIMALHTRLPEAGPLHAISWEPAYAGTLVTRENWPQIPDGRRRVIREWQEVSRRISDGGYLPAQKRDGTWQ
jgi:uncharacterized SAM-binding protein YcdF (DUF218 family)